MDTPLDFTDGTWDALVPEPTSLIALWPGDAAPALSGVVARLSAHVDGPVSVIEELPADDPGVAWSAALSLPSALSPIVVWVEPAQPMHADERQRLGVPACAWALGLQAQLDRADPLTGFHNLIGVVAGAFPDVPALLDVNTTQWALRSDLDAMSAPDGIEPAVEILWTTQVVEGRSGAEPVAWVHTHGLWRCGRVELEMIEVPARWTMPAVELMNDVAGLLVERETPVLGRPFEIGPELSVTLQPWQAVVPCVADGAPGGEADRVGDGADAHTGPRVVICANEPVGSYKKIWVWPRAEVERRRTDESMVYVTTRAIERQAALAQAGWRRFVQAFGARTVDARFGVKAGFTDQAEPGAHGSQGVGDREHLWFEVCRAEARRVEGRLVHQPRGEHGLHLGDRTWIDVDSVSDWRVVTRERSFGPDDAAALRDATLREATS